MDTIRDNPLFTKHVRSRLRNKEVWPSLMVLVILCTFLCYVTTGEPHGTAPDLPFRVIVVIQCLILFLMGTGQVFGSVYRARENSVLDFHRISPLSALNLTVGFLFGAPVREYLMFACTLPFSLFTLASGAISPPGWLLVEVCVIVAAVLYHLLAFMVALLADKGRAGVGPPVLIFFLYAFSALPPVKYFTILPAYLLMLHWPVGMTQYDALLSGELGTFLLALLHQGIFIGFLLLGAVRKMRQEQSPLWPKALAVVFYFLLARLTTLDLAQSNDLHGAEGVIALYVLLAIGLFMTFAVTPPAQDFVRGLRRAHKLGQHRLSLWADPSTNWVPLAIYCGILVATVTLTGVKRGPGALDDVVTENLTMAAVIGACVLFYCGSGLQTSLLRFKKQGRGYFLLLLFCLWVVPILLGSILGIVHNAENASMLAFSLSPICGLAMVLAGKTAWTLSYVLILNAGLAAAFTALRLQDEKRALASLS